MHETLLVSSPGFGVIDSGCGRTIVGRETLAKFKQMWQQHGPEPEPEINYFRYGNGEKETSTEVLALPVRIAGKSGSIRAAIVQGQAPLLISRAALQKLKATLAFGQGTMTIFDDAVQVPLHTNSAGQFMIRVLPEETKGKEVQFSEVMASQEANSCCDHEPTIAPSMPETALDLEEQAQDSADTGHPGSSVWSRADEGLTLTPVTGKQAPFWHTVIHRTIHDLDTGRIVSDQTIDHSKDKRYYIQPLPQDVRRTRTDFVFMPQEHVNTIESLPVQVCRQLTAQIKQAPSRVGSFVQGKRFMLAEIFSPPRFAPSIEAVGGFAMSCDLKTGYDFSKAQCREETKQFLKQHPPDLLVLCPPCTYEGGWFNLNACTMDPME